MKKERAHNSPELCEYFRIVGAFSSFCSLFVGDDRAGE